jgi:hypothetical protein
MIIFLLLALWMANIAGWIWTSPGVGCSSELQPAPLVVAVFVVDGVRAGLL